MIAEVQNQRAAHRKVVKVTINSKVVLCHQVKKDGNEQKVCSSYQYIGRKQRYSLSYGRIVKQFFEFVHIDYYFIIMDFILFAPKRSFSLSLSAVLIIISSLLRAGALTHT